MTWYSALVFASILSMRGADWPACTVRAGTTNASAIIVNARPHAPILFMGNNQFGRDEVLLDQTRLAAEAGITIFSFNVHLDWHQSEEEAARIIDKFCAAHPKGYFYVRMWLGPNRAWCDAHPDECITKANGARMPYASPSSRIWRADAEHMLRTRVRQILQGPHCERFIGVCLCYLQTGEWFYEEAEDFMDYSPANLAAFREWLNRTYKTSMAHTSYTSTARLRRAWGRPDINVRTASLPTPEARDAATWGPFRHPVTHRPAIDMQRFQAELMADTIVHFARVVKEETRGRSLVGAFYGYTMELNNNGPRALAHSGHLAFGKLLRCKDLDIIHAPYSYFERKVGQPGHLHLPADSLALRHKLGIFEDDTYTHLAVETPDSHMIAPGWLDRTRNIEETLAVSRRNVANCLTHRCGVWVFDLLSDGRWYDKTFWDAVPLYRRMAAESRGAAVFRPEVAMVVDEDSVHFLRASTHPLLIHSLSWQRSELDRIGTPVGYYLQSDLARLPDSVRVLIMANAYHIGKAQRRLVEKFLNKGGTVLWMYAPNIVGPAGPDAARISDITGIALRAAFDEVRMCIRTEQGNEQLLLGPESWQPRFVVASTDIEVLCRYADTNEVSAAAKPIGRGLSIYSATPRLPVSVLRSICERAGIHLYRNTPGMTGVIGDYLVVHTETAATHHFRWPSTCRTIQRLVPYSSTPIARETNAWSDVLPELTTAIYLCR